MAIRQIKADGTGDFTTIAAWLASLPGTLVEDEIAEITGTINATGAATNFQVTTSPTARVIIRAAAGQETTYRSGDGKARIDFGAFDFVINSTSSKHVTIENVALYLGVGSSSRGIIMESSGAPSGADWQFRNLFIAKGGTNNSMGISRPFPGLVIENCIIFGLGGATNTGVVLRGSSLIAGFTPVDLGLSSADTGTVERCYFANNAYAFGQLFSADSSADLGFSDTNKNRNIPGTVVTNAALLDQYTDPVNGDWSFKAGNALQGAATGGADIGFVSPGAAPPSAEKTFATNIAAVTGISGVLGAERNLASSSIASMSGTATPSNLAVMRGIRLAAAVTSAVTIGALEISGQVQFAAGIAAASGTTAALARIRGLDVATQAGSGVSMTLVTPPSFTFSAAATSFGTFALALERAYQAEIASVSAATGFLDLQIIVPVHVNVQALSVRTVPGLPQLPGVAKKQNVELIPFAPSTLTAADVPAFLQTQSKVLREQHEKLQFGGLTKDFQLATEVHTTPRFPLGVCAKFEHPELGEFMAQYVKFDEMTDSTLGAPVGIATLAEPHVVTNAFDKTAAKEPCGLLIAERVPSSGSYGWIQQTGLNLNPTALAPTAGQSTRAGKGLSWPATGVLGTEAEGIGPTVAIQVTDAPVDPGGTLPAGSIRCVMNTRDYGVVAETTTGIITDPVTGNAALATTMFAVQSALTQQGELIELTSGSLLEVKAQIENPATGLLALADGQQRLLASLTLQGKSIEATSADISEIRAVINDPATGNQALAGNLLSLENRVSQNESGITAAAETVAELQAAIESPVFGLSALSQASNSLQVRTTATEDTVTTQATQITTLQADVALAQQTADGAVATNQAQGTAIDSLDTRVTATETAVTTQATQITTLQTGVALAQQTADGAVATNQAQGTAIDSLDTRVTATESAVTTQAAQITTLQADVVTAQETADGAVTTNQAQASALDALDTRVTATETGLASTSSAVTAVQSQVNLGMDANGVLLPGVTPLANLANRTLDEIFDSATRFAAAEPGATRTAAQPANLFHVSTAGVVSSRTLAFSVGSETTFGKPDGTTGVFPDERTYVPIEQLGILPGSTITATAIVTSDFSNPGNNRLRLSWVSSSGSAIGVSDSAAIPFPASDVLASVTGTVPANATHVRLTVRIDGGTGTVSIRQAMMNVGNVAAPYIPPTRGADETATATAFTTLSTNVDTIDGQVQEVRAQWGVVVDVNNRVTGAIRLDAGLQKSTFDVLADAFRVFNGSTDVPVFAVENGNITLIGDLQVGRGVFVGAGRIPVALQAFELLAADGAVVTYPADLGSLPILTFDSNGLAPLGAGESYSIEALNPTSTGFTLSAKIISPGTTTNVVETSVTTSGTVPTHRIDKVNSTIDGKDGHYTFKGEFQSSGIESPDFPGSFLHEVEIDLYIDPGTGFQLVGTVQFSQMVLQQVRTFAFSQLVTFSTPIVEGAQKEFGFNLRPGGTGIGLANLSVEYQAQTVSSTRTASPSGEQVKVTVFPRNVVPA